MRRTTNNAVFPEGAKGPRRAPARDGTPKGSSALRADAYTCPELGRTSLRAGAYDLLERPSLIGGQRVRPRIASC